MSFIKMRSTKNLQVICAVTALWKWGFLFQPFKFCTYVTSTWSRWIIFVGTVHTGFLWCITTSAVNPEWLIPDLDPPASFYFSIFGRKKNIFICWIYWTFLYNSLLLCKVRVKYEYSTVYTKLNFGWSLCLTTVYNYAHFRRIRNHKFKR